MIFILSVNFPEFRTGGDGLNCEFISAKMFVCLLINAVQLHIRMFRHNLNLVVTRLISCQLFFYNSVM